MLASEASVRKTTLLLHRDSLCSVFNDSLSVVDVILAGSQGCACKSSSRSDNSAGHVNHASKYSELSATRGIHQGDRCLVWSVCCLRVLCSS